MANANAPAVAPASLAINCNRADAVPSKACKKCGAVKPRTEFQGNPRCADGRIATCRACTNTARNRTDAERIGTVHTARDGTGTLSPRVVAVTAQTTAKLVTFDTLTDDARRLKGEAAVYQHGRSKITAVYDRVTDSTHYKVSGWFCPADDLRHIFRVIHSGQPVNWLP